jgi:hypothetical protein
VIGFVLFLYQNGSIVVGDKENHVVGVHFAMISHLSLLYTLLALPSLLDRLFLQRGKRLFFFLVFHFQFTMIGTTSTDLKTWEEMKKLKNLSFLEIIGYLLSGVAGGYMLIKGSKSHPFLLSDNRYAREIIIFNSLFNILDFLRHYVFYIWQRILSKPRIRYVFLLLFGSLLTFFVFILSFLRSDSFCLHCMVSAQYLWFGISGDRMAHSGFVFSWWLFF